MRILFLNQFFYPDLAATSQYLTDLTRALALEDATVICSGADYVSSGGEEPPPVSVVRLATLRFCRTGRRKRLFSYVSFLISATWAAFRMPKQDVVVTLTTPPLLSFVGLMLQYFRGSRHVIWEMDVYPDIAFDLGMLKPFTLLTRVVRHLSDRARRRADAVIALGECMKTRLLSHGVQERRVHIVENWADGQTITPQPFPTGHALVLHYSGNMGIAHDESTLRDVILELSNSDRFHFIVSGGGSRRAKLQAWCEAQGILNVSFRPYCSNNELSNSLAEGHIGIVTQMPETLGSMVPSKTYGIMAAARPLLYIGPRGSAPARIIERYRCGWHFENGDVEGVTTLLEELWRHRRPMMDAGWRGRGAFEANYDRPLAVAQISRVLGVETPFVPRKRAALAHCPGYVDADVALGRATAAVGFAGRE